MTEHQMQLPKRGLSQAESEMLNLLPLVYIEHNFAVSVTPKWANANMLFHFVLLH